MSLRRVTGGLFVGAFVTALVGASMFGGRGGPGHARSPGETYLIWERGFFVSAVILTALGFSLMEGLLTARGDAVFARLGSTTFLIAAVILLMAEVTGLPLGEPAYRLIETYVALAFAAEAFIGVSVLTTDLLPGWIGWTAIGWNVGWPIFLFMARPSDVYIPLVHHVVPLVIGVSLLLHGAERGRSDGG